ncbi:MAG TPA: ABC transporter ATP-binding protein [Pirellulales bacterium]|jgi:lipopolysaccharide transport system ATP-binding protein
MHDAVLKIEQLGKRYRYAPGARRHATLRDRLGHTTTAALRRITGQTASAEKADVPDGYWALRDISVNVAAGEVFGLVGHNGSGKSTLLKILARITGPSSGRALVRGRVGALLEIGTGFHMELNGRENVYLSGAILGMRRADIRAKFDAIVAMAGVAPFLELPVKRYSSGMYLRLAFAVAAHLDSEILLLDEVLAVGDAAFQQACREKILELARSGRTIIMVSHDWDLVRTICDRAMLLERGQMMSVGRVGEVLSRAAA